MTLEYDAAEEGDEVEDLDLLVIDVLVYFIIILGPIPRYQCNFERCYFFDLPKIKSLEHVLIV